MRSKKRTIGILIVVIVVLLGFAGSLLVYINKLSSKDTKSNLNNNITQSLSSVSPQRYLEDFYNKPITDEKIALNSIEENRVQLGYDDENLSFEFMRKDEYMGASYRFKLLYKGIPLDSKEVRVLVDENGTARKLLSREISIKQLNTINTTPKITQDEAINITSETLGDNFSEYNISANFKQIRICPELIIYETNDEYILAYYIKSGFYLCIINAENGEIITSKSSLLSNMAEFEGQNGDKHTIYYDDYKDENYDIKNALWDKNNNIYIFDNVFYPNNIEDIMTIDNIKSGKNKTAVDAMANTYRAVEYFKIKHNMTFDATFAIVNYLNFDLMYNSGGTSYINDNVSVAKICFGTSFGTKQDSAYLDIVAHEYAHAVTSLRAFGSDGYSTDSKYFERDALGEAYSDIFGQLIEQEYTGATDWIQNLNILGKRDLKQPKISNYSELGKNAHDNSTIISYTAYLMSKDNDNSEWDSKYLLEYDQLGKLWFGSLDYLDKESRFSDCRYAIEESARDLIDKGVLRDGNLKVIEQAFDEVGVSSNPTRRGAENGVAIKEKHTATVPIEDETQSSEPMEIEEIEITEPTTTAKTEQTTTTTEPISTIPEDACIYNGHSYMVCPESMTWQEAKEYCENIGGHLVTISDADEQKFVEDLAEKYTDKVSYWLGGSYSDAEWKWVDDTEFSYTNWDSWSDGEKEYRQPDNHTGDEFYLRFANRKIQYSTWYSNKGKWNDVSNEADGSTGDVPLNSFGLICEWDSVERADKAEDKTEDVNPEDTIRKMERALNNLDMKELIECYEPQVQKMYNEIFKFNENLMGMDIGSLLGGFTNIYGKEFGLEMPEITINIDNQEYISSEQVKMRLTIHYQNSTISDETVDINLIRIDDIWYISSEISLQ